MSGAMLILVTDPDYGIVSTLETMRVAQSGKPEELNDPSTKKQLLC